MPGRQERTILDTLRGTREAPGRQDRQPARHQGGTREAGKDRLDTREARKDHLESLGGTREAPGRQERSSWTACEAPGRHQGGRKGLIGQPGGHHEGRKLPFGQPGRHQGDTREAGRDHLDSLGGTRGAPGSGLLRASLCYGQPAVGPTPGSAANRAVRH